MAQHRAGADAPGTPRGGHLLQGCQARTTAEQFPGAP